MFSKILRTCLATAGAFLLCGCGVKLWEKAPQQGAVSYSGKGYSCVGQIPQNVEKYINDEMTDQEITEFVRCMQRAFTTFGQYTHGRDQSTYAPDEIRRFLESYFIRDRKISDGLLHEFMVIKQSLVGGDEGRVARSELADAVEFLEDIRLEAIRLRPHVKYLNPRLVVQQDPHEVGRHLSEANEALKQSIQVFSNRLQKSKRVYPLENLGNFLTEFRQFVRWDEHFKSAHTVPQWIALLRAFKETTVSPVNPDVIRESEWVPLLQGMSGWYLSYLQFQTGIRHHPVLHGFGLQNSIYLGNDVLELVRGALNRRPGKTVSFTELNRLFVALHDIGWLPQNVRPSSLDQAARAFGTRMVGDGSSDGINLVTVSNVEREFYRWAYVQMSLENNFRRDIPSIDQNTPNLQPRMSLFSDVRLQTDSLKNADWDEFIKVKSLMRPLFNNQDPRVQVIPVSQLGNYDVKQGFTNLSNMNLLRSLMTLIFRGYSSAAPPRSMWDAGITGPEMQAFYMDFRELGIDLGLVDKRNLNSGSRAFVEGKLFTYSSRGLQYNGPKGAQGTLSFVEAMEYFAFLYSGGNLADQVYDQLAKRCDHGPLDINGVPKILRACAEVELPRIMAAPEFFYNMPGLQNYVRGSNDVALRYGKTLLDMVRGPASEDLWVERNELCTLTVVSHYAESVMTRYDANQDGILDNAELEQAVPVFAGFIKKVAQDTQNKSLTDSQARGAFFFILQNKTIPSSWRDNLEVLRNEYLTPDVELDRAALADVFKAIIGKLFEVGKKSATAAPAVIPPPPAQAS